MKTTKSGNVAERAAVNNLIVFNASKAPRLKFNKSGSANERSAMNILLFHLKVKYKSSLYIFVDRDAGEERHTTSGFDFELVRGPYCVFVEAKVGPGKLTEYQEFTRAEVKAAGGQYVVARFSEDGQRVAVDGRAPRAVSDITLSEFFRGWK